MKIRLPLSLSSTIATLLCWMIPATVTARVTCIRLTSNHIADTTDLRRFRQFHKWKDKTGNELALAIWRYLSDYKTGLYHFNEIPEDLSQTTVISLSGIMAMDFFVTGPY